MGNFRTKAAFSWKVFIHVLTMPWWCLLAAIEQILQESDPIVQAKQLREWQRLKNAELMNVSFVGTLIASAVTGSIQWNLTGTAHWTVYAAWFGTLVLSLIAVMVAFYQSILLSNFVINTSGDRLLLAALRSTHNPKKARWGSLFALQVPITLLSYALMSYVVGLTVLVLKPLWSGPWGSGSWIAIIYIVTLSLSILAFGAVAHFIYVQNAEVLKVQ